MSAALDAGRRALRLRVKRANAGRTDRLAERAALVRRGAFMLGGLRHVGWTAGRSDDWLWERMFPLADRHPEVIGYGRVPLRVAA